MFPTAGTFTATATSAAPLRGVVPSDLHLFFRGRYHRQPCCAGSSARDARCARLSPTAWRSCYPLSVRLSSGAGLDWAVQHSPVLRAPWCPPGRSLLPQDLGLSCGCHGEGESEPWHWRRVVSAVRRLSSVPSTEEGCRRHRSVTLACDDATGRDGELAPSVMACAAGPSPWPATPSAPVLLTRVLLLR
jgi:hypothetical protein